MRKKLLMTGLLLLLLLIGCSKKDTDVMLEEQQEDVQEEYDTAEESEDLSETEDTESEDMMNSDEVVTESPEETSEDLEPTVEQEKETYMSFKTESGYIGYKGSVDNADWLNCYMLNGYYDGDDFIVNEMTYQYVKDNNYDFYAQCLIYFDGSLTIKDDYKVIAQTEEYSIYQDSEANLYAQIPAFNNMVISGDVEESEIQAFLRSYSYEADDNSKDLFNSVAFGNYRFADQIKLSAYPEITFEALTQYNAFYPLEYILLCNDIEIGMSESMKTKASDNVNGNSSKKKVEQDGTFPNFNIYETSSSVYFIGGGDSPSITFYDSDAQDAYDSVKELLVKK